MGRQQLANCTEAPSLPSMDQALPWLRIVLR
jgi:hypothetical protein